MKLSGRNFLCICTFLLFSSRTFAGMVTDTLLPDNLIHTPGYQTSEWGSLPYTKFGAGKQTLLLLPGWGFDGSVFETFVQNNLSNYTMFLLTLPGYGDTRAYPMPPDGTSYGEGTWCKGVEHGILQLLEAEKLERPVLVAHFSVSSHIALHLAATHPDKFKKLVLIGAPATLRYRPPYDTLSYQGRVRSVDQGLAPRWFKTLNMETWRKGNFPPGTYSLDSLEGNRLYELANKAPLPVQIRYLCEYWAADFSCYTQVAIPVLVATPSFSPAVLNNPQNIFCSWYTEAWNSVADQNPNIHLHQVAGSACNLMQDKPAVFQQLLADFLRD